MEPARIAVWASPHRRDAIEARDTFEHRVIGSLAARADRRRSGVEHGSGRACLSLCGRHVHSIGLLQLHQYRKPDTLLDKAAASAC